MARPDVRGRALGALYMTVFGAVWAAGATGAAGAGALRGVAFACIMAITGALVLAAGALWRAARRAPGDAPLRPSPAGAGAGRTMRLYYLIVCAEGAAIAAAVAILIRGHQAMYIAPAVAAIVGAHFLPLAALFEERLYYATGALLILMAVATIGVVPATAMLGGARARMALPMAGSAVVLWLTALGVVLLGRAALAKRSPVGHGDTGAGRDQAPA